jgi:hypothetical protein
LKRAKQLLAHLVRNAGTGIGDRDRNVVEFAAGAAARPAVLRLADDRDRSARARASPGQR